MQLLPQTSANKAITSSGSAFAISEPNGNMQGGSTDGFYSADTRFLSKLKLLLGGREPGTVGLSVQGYAITSFYSALTTGTGVSEESLSIVRDRMVEKGLHEDIYVANHSIRPRAIRLELELDADFADVFEVRRGQFQKQGVVTSQAREDTALALVYESTDFHRETWFRLSETPEMNGQTARYEFELAPRGVWKTCLEVVPAGKGLPTKTRCVRSFLSPPFAPDGSNTTRSGAKPRSQSKDNRVRGRKGARPLDGRLPVLESDSPEVEAVYSRALDDLKALQIEVIPGRFILAAGIPWFMALFGRDSIISAIQTKLLGQDLMVNTLHTLSSFQATSINDFREAQPGKIPHEIRYGELSVGEKVPHSRYYGTVDATPLFLILLSEAFTWTGNARLIERFASAAEAALLWIDKFGDMDGDGFVEYEQRTPEGLRNQGWKDSEDSVSFADGRLAEPPIALAEVQGYVYSAKVRMAELYRIIGNEEKSDTLNREARALKQKFNKAFWMEDEGFLATALDRQKRQVDSITSNAGQCLWTEIVDTDKSPSVVRRLLADDMFNGWGIRTLSTKMARFEPLSYHNGSVWPHDNSLIAAGMDRYGFVHEANKVALAILDAASSSEHRRPPELFAGYSRRDLSSPVPYPAANAPQAWASGAVIQAIETLMGVTPRDNHLFLEARLSGPSISLRGVPFRGSRRYL